MSIPVDPTITAIVTDGLKRGGRTTPTPTDITNATELMFRAVMDDLSIYLQGHEYLKTNQVAITTINKSRYTRPVDADHVLSVQILDGPDQWRSQATGGGSNTITLGTGINAVAQPTDITSKWILITGGTGAGQIAQCISYVVNTSVATIEDSWANLGSGWVAPDSTSTYLIVSEHIYIYREDKQDKWDFRRAPWGIGRPRNAAIYNGVLYPDYVPDKVYGIWWWYIAHPDRIDQSSVAMAKILREWRNIITQGIAAIASQRFEDDRETKEWQLYLSMLQMLGTKSPCVHTVAFHDV